MKTASVNNANFTGLTPNARVYIADKIWSMASHGRAKEAIKTSRLFQYFYKEKNHTLDIVGYNGSRDRVLLVYKADDLARHDRDAVNPISSSVLFKIFEQNPKYVLNKLTDVQKNMGGKIPQKRRFTSVEQDFIDKFERSDSRSYNADGLYGALKNLERYYKYGKKTQ